MKFTIINEKIKGDSIDLTCSFWTGWVKAHLDGKPLVRLKEKYAPFLVPAKTGDSIKLLVKLHWFDPIPAISLDSQEILLAPKLSKIQCLFALLPLVLFLGHGPLPALYGLIVIKMNFRILRTSISNILKWLVIYAQSLVNYFLLNEIMQLLYTGIKCK